MRWTVIAALAMLASPVLARDTAQEGIDYDPNRDIIVSDDISALPPPVQVTRQRLLDAAKSGDIEALQPIVDSQRIGPIVSFGNDVDTIDYLTQGSADGKGYEKLAILGETLDAPYAIFAASSDHPTYVWPYLVLIDGTKLTPPQQVDLYRLMPPEYAKQQLESSTWQSYRVEIQPDGQWYSFVAGD